MNPKEHSFKFYSDPAHGWLEMPLKVIKELEMEMFQISEFSYYDKKTDFVYVEQDCDLTNVKTKYERKFNQKLLVPERVVYIELDENIDKIHKGSLVKIIPFELEGEYYD